MENMENIETKLDLQRLLFPSFDHKSYARCATFGEYWQICPKGSWMLGVATEIGVNRRVLARAAARCVHAAEHLLTESSRTPLHAVCQYSYAKMEAGELLPFVEVAKKTEFWLRYAGNKAEHVAAEAVLSAITFCADGHKSNAEVAAIHTAAAYAASRVREALMKDNVDVVDAAALYAQHVAEKERQLAEICREELTKAVLARVKELEEVLKD